MGWWSTTNELNKPAVPCEVKDGRNDYAFKGLSKLEHIATQLLQGLNSNSGPFVTESSEVLAKKAVEQARALMKEIHK